VGPSEAAILSTFEPVVTVVLAFFALGERLTPLQLAGGALVLAAVVLLQLPARRRVSARLAEAPA
jgi:drug/metabolite transporter (DMT)-like permease